MRTKTNPNEQLARSTPPRERIADECEKRARGCEATIKELNTRPFKKYHVGAGEFAFYTKAQRAERTAWLASRALEYHQIAAELRKE